LFNFKDNCLCCSQKYLKISKINQIGVSVTFDIKCNSCNKNFKWKSSNLIPNSNILQTNKSVQVSGQLSNISYPEFYRFLSGCNIKTPKFFEFSNLIFKKSEKICSDNLNDNIDDCINNDLFYISKFIHILTTDYTKDKNNKYVNQPSKTISEKEILTHIYQYAYGQKYQISMIFDGRYDCKRNAYL
jgi:hypothetical protein